MPNDLITTFLLLISLASIVLYSFFEAKIKGMVGEKIVASILSLLDNSKYKVINNVVLKIGGKTSQIDHVVISDFGIFVIETKNYKGWILGGENAEYWTQVLYKRKEKLYNPIRQNLGHILALKKNLSEFPNARYISIIAFSSRAEIKVNTNTEVIYISNLPKVIKKYTEVSLSKGEKEKIFEKINSINLRGKYDKSQHIKFIAKRIEEREKSIRQKKCPQCGEDLILREGKFGKFLGCNKYPICKFTTNF